MGRPSSIDNMSGDVMPLLNRKSVVFVGELYVSTTPTSYVDSKPGTDRPSQPHDLFRRLGQPTYSQVRTTTVSLGFALSRIVPDRLAVMWTSWSCLVRRILFLRHGLRVRCGLRLVRKALRGVAICTQVSLGAIASAVSRYTDQMHMAAD